MQKITLAGLLAAGIISFAPLAQAASQNNGGFNGPNTMTIMTVEQAQGLTDETAVVLQGNIQKSLGDDMYLFSDGTGTFNVEIDEGDWNGINVNPDDVILIQGEIDRDGNVVSIDVDEVSLAQ